MRATAKGLANTAAVLTLTFIISGYIAWTPGYAPMMNSLLGTAAWRALRNGDAWLRLSLGARVGPESDEMLFVWCSLGLSLAFSVALVWGANRLLRRFAGHRRSPAGAILKA